MPHVIETHGPGKHAYYTVGQAFNALEAIRNDPSNPKPLPNMEGSNLKKPDKDEDILRLDRPAATIRAGGRAWHPTLNRAITPREAAALQSDDPFCEFEGTITEQYRWVFIEFLSKFCHILISLHVERFRLLDVVLFDVSQANW